jgi:hypothetical protein
MSSTNRRQAETAKSNGTPLTKQCVVVRGFRDHLECKTLNRACVQPVQKTDATQQLKLSTAVSRSRRVWSCTPVMDESCPVKHEQRTCRISRVKWDSSNGTGGGGGGDPALLREQCVVD